MNCKHPILAILFAALLAPVPSGAENIVFPPAAGAVNVKEVYGVKGDGVTDDTDALQHAIFEKKGKNAVLYFPNGTYLVSRTLFVGGTAYSADPIASKAHSSDRFMNLQGQSEAGVVIKLKDSSPGFNDPQKPKVMFSLYDGQGTGDVMHTYVRNMTFDVGKGNPGAAGLRYLSDNTGAMYHVTIRSSDPNKAGSIGLDLRQGQQGPELIRDVTIDGFDRGVQTGDTFSIVFERLTLKNQRQVGFLNPNGRVTIRGLTSFNKVPVIKSGGDPFTLIEGSFQGGSATESAIITTGRKNYVRDLKQSGYGAMIETTDKKKITGTQLDEWLDGEGKGLFTTEIKSLRLPIKETPEVPWEQDLGKWVVLDDSQPDDTESIQKEIDAAAKAGKTTICFKPGEHKYRISAPIKVHGSINRIIGMESLVDVNDASGVFKAGQSVLVFDGLLSNVLIVERFFLFGGWKGPDTAPMFENKAGKTIVVQSTGIQGAVKNVSPAGEWFIDDVSPSRNGTLKIGPGEKVWARQYNPESYKTDMIEVTGGQLWLLGLKTEGRATHLVAKAGAKVEIIGGLSYQSWDKQELDPPMFKITDSAVSITMGVWSSRFPFSTIVEETFGGETKTLKPKELSNWHLGLYRSGTKQ